jgi:choline dehydrogenase-like flavoprotein
MADPDVVVVGSGPTGAMAASALVDRGLDVLMLDAGTGAPGGLIVRAAGNTMYRRFAWADYESERLDPSSDDGVEWYSSRSLGGLSNYWTAAVPRFAPEDFTEGARLDERYRWPVTYAELEPFYRRAEQFLTVTAGDPILRVPAGARRYEYRLAPRWRTIAAEASRHGHGVGAMPLAKGRPWMVARRATEFNSYHCVVAPLLSTRSFRLLTHAQAVRLTWSSTAGRVEGVEYVDRTSGELRSARARAVVVACGAIDSTVLLMRSRSDDFPDGLGNAHGLLGRYLHDHPREWWPARARRPLPALAHPVYVTRDPWASSEPLMATSLTLGLRRPAQRLQTFYRGSSRHFAVQVFGTMVPTPEVGVSIGHDEPADALALRPRITLHYDGAAVANLLSGRRRLIEVLGSAGVEAELPGPFHDIHPGSSVHYGGSVRMHADPAFGVLDGWNRMHDVANVAVVDSSAFTTGAEKNPTLTAMVLALRAADRLADDLRAGAI